MSTTAVFVSHLEPRTADIANKETLVDKLDGVTTSNPITDINSMNKISQTENELGSKLKVAGVYVLSSTFISLIIVFLISQLLSSLGGMEKATNE